MNIAFTMPPRGGQSSGGYFYNDQLIAGLRSIGHDVRVVESFDDPIRGVDVVIEDELGYARQIETEPGVRRVALVHVPSFLIDPDSPSDPEQQFLDRCDAAVFVSHATLADTRAVIRIPERSVVVEPGVDHVPLGGNRAHNAQLHLVSVGHLTPHKGMMRLMDVLEELHASTASWRATIIGSHDYDPDYAQATVTRAEEAGLSSHVRFLGYKTIEEIRVVMETADAFVSTSCYESYGIAATEALACGVPVFSWARGGLADVVGVGGVSVPLGDQRALARELYGIVLDRRRHTRLRQRALERARRLPTWAGGAHRWSQLLSQVVE